MTYIVSCPALDEKETTTDEMHAMEVCLSMADESNSPAYIHDCFGNLIGSY